MHAIEIAWLEMVYINLQLYVIYISNVELLKLQAFLKIISISLNNPADKCQVLVSNIVRLKCVATCKMICNNMQV